MSVTKQDAAEEKYRWAMKYFDYAEQPIKQVLSRYMADKHGVDCPTDCEYDVLGFEQSGQSYKMYLSTDGTEAMTMTDHELGTNPKIQEAAAILYKAMQTAFMPVLNTIYGGNSQEIKDDISHLTMKFDETGNCFYLQKINRLAMEQQQISNMILDILNEENKHGPSHPNAQKLGEYKLELITRYNKINQDTVDYRQNIADAFNSNVVNQQYRVYMCLSQVAEQGDLAMKRLPSFGMPYQDPDEETELDKFKKENAV